MSLKVALIGYGAMGKLISGIVDERDHEVSAVIDEKYAGADAAGLAELLKTSDVVIDFSTASAVRRNVEAGMLAGVSVVEGTTGWASEMESIKSTVAEADGSFVFGANFSIGVNLFYRITDYASELFSRFDEYEAYLEEQHHSRKLDAPSGTALKLKSIVDARIGRDHIVSSTRAGSIPGTHRIGFDGPADQINLEHIARSRQGFAEGAVFAAEWIAGRKGFYEFSDVMDEVLNSSR
ncbi:MAG: dihydrodipicolinate reductase C-terminal domain-containing protein [Pyrinomonadaceae bacterium]